MLSPPPLPNLLTSLWADLHNMAFLWQAAAAVASLLLAWLIGKLLQPKIAALENSPAIGRDMLTAIRFPLVAVMLVLCARAVLDGLGTTTTGSTGLTLLDLMVALLTAAIIIRLVVVMLRQVFAPSG